ncbi:MAG: FitA-like ribbon-helix-helix domain-containing protein [Actinomycetes bacterium]
MKTIQIRHVPDEVHRTLKSRAALAGMSLSDYALDELRRVAEQPSQDEVLDRLLAMEPVDLPVSAADIIREERDRR